MGSMDPTAKPGTTQGRVEARWPAGLTVVALLFLLVAVPRSVRVLPEWVLYATACVVLLPMLGASFYRGSARWTRTEHVAMVAYFVIAAPSTLVALVTLIAGMVRGDPGLNGIELLVASSMLWISNVLIFSLVFWHVDAGGPHARAGEPQPRPDWLFPQYGLPAEFVPPGWQPTFVDYLYLALSTATAFSSTDVAPLTARAKRLMMIELAVSLVTIVVVGARAINILGS